MSDTKTPIEQAYSAFNKRDIDGALALMTEDVSWPKSSEGVAELSERKRSAPIGLDNEASSIPTSNRWQITEEDGGRVRVRVHQVVRSLQGTFCRTARSSTYSLSTSDLSQLWTSEMRPMQRMVRLPKLPHSSTSKRSLSGPPATAVVLNLVQ